MPISGVFIKVLFFFHPLYMPISGIFIKVFFFFVYRLPLTTGVPCPSKNPKVMRESLRADAEAPRCHGVMAPYVTSQASPPPFKEWIPTAPKLRCQGNRQVTFTGARTRSP